MHLLNEEKLIDADVHLAISGKRRVNNHTVPSPNAMQWHRPESSRNDCRRCNGHRFVAASATMPARWRCPTVSQAHAGSLHFGSPLSQHWDRIRTMYSPNRSGFVFSHETFLGFKEKKPGCRNRFFESFGQQRSGGRDLIRSCHGDPHMAAGFAKGLIRESDPLDPA